jgi:Spy/CpxP family protein refolding chaperone
MKKIVTASFLAAALFAASQATAMPLAPLAPAPADVIEVAGGCGPGWHRGPYGGCRRNYAQPWLHACPRGWYPGPYGRCRANGR